MLLPSFVHCEFLACFPHNKHFTLLFTQSNHCVNDRPTMACRSSTISRPTAQQLLPKPLRPLPIYAAGSSQRKEGTTHSWQHRRLQEHRAPGRYEIYHGLSTRHILIHSQSLPGPLSVTTPSITALGSPIAIQKRKWRGDVSTSTVFHVYLDGR